VSEKTLLATMTGEHFQPVRLHYTVFDRKALLRAFKKLRCVDRDPTQLRWVWLYDFEARTLPFQRSSAQIPRQYRPIIIGSFIPRSEDKMVLDLRSYERAILAIPFFDKHIPRSVAKATGAEVVNRLFSVEEAQITPDQLFDRQETPVDDPEAILRGIAERVAPIQDPQEKFRLASECLEVQAKRPLPEIEWFPIHYYEEGIQSFQTALKMRQIIASQHWLGNTSYSMHDIIQEMMQRMK
jgi:hypothetical protein